MNNSIKILLVWIIGLLCIGMAYYLYNKHYKTTYKILLVCGVLIIIVGSLQKESFTETQKKKLKFKYQVMGYEAGDSIAKLIIQNEDILHDLDNIFNQYSNTLKMKALNTHNYAHKNRLLNASSFFNDVSGTIKCGILGENCSLKEKMDHHYVVAGPLQVMPNTKVKYVIVKPFEVRSNAHIMHVVVSQVDIKHGVNSSYNIVKSPHINDDLPKHAVIIEAKDVKPNIVINHVVVAPQDVLPNVIVKHLVVKPNQVKQMAIPSHVVIASHIANRELLVN